MHATVGVNCHAMSARGSRERTTMAGLLEAEMGAAKVLGRPLLDPAALPTPALG